MRSQRVTRAYHLPCYPNRDKLDTARYLFDRFNLYVQHCVGRQYFESAIKSTSGAGKLFNQANNKARNIVRKHKASIKATGNKSNVPSCRKEKPPVRFELSKGSSYDYIVKVSNQFEPRKIVKIPANSTKVLNKALKNNWKLTNFGEIFFRKDKMFLTVFVQKEVDIAEPNVNCIGVDVGINKSVVTSEGHFGKSLNSVIKKFKDSQRERYRQRTKFNQKQTLRKNSKTQLKQILDREAKLVVGRSKNTQSSLVVESRKTLNNLRSGKLSLWARNYMANRCEILCNEEGVFFLEVNPWNSSKTCSCCREIGERVKEVFVCKNTNCSEYLREVDADLNASKELRNRGRSVILDKIIPKWQSGGRRSFVLA
jgi:transposase